MGNVTDSGNDYGPDGETPSILKHPNEKSVIYSMDILKIFIQMETSEDEQLKKLFEIETLADKSRSYKLQQTLFHFSHNCNY